MATDPTRESARRARREILIYGACCGVLVAVLHALEYRLLLVENSLALYGGLVAVLFAAVGVGLGRTMRGKPVVVVREVPVPSDTPFAVDDDKVRALGITPRELEILGQIAGGLSNREIAARLFVSENTVKTHSSRLFDKLGAKRRTQAVQIGKAERLIP